MNEREQRGLALAALYKIEQQDGKWIVPSQSDNGTKYTVDLDPQAEPSEASTNSEEQRAEDSA